MSNTTEFATICGKTIQIDRSGVGHAWRNLPVADLYDDTAEIIAGEIIDGNRPTGSIVIGGIHYRWK